MNKLIKVCGMRQAENIRAVEALGIDMMGFIFYPKSPRFVQELPAYMPTSAQRVGVFVNETEQAIMACAERYGLNYVQLHGQESPDFCKTLQAQGMKVMKALSIGRSKDLDNGLAYEGVCDYLLFDTLCEQHGGSGKQFDWELLNQYRGSTPFLLSGGIDAGSARALRAIRHEQLAGFDINSRFEQQPGLKDMESIKAFLNDLQRKK